MKNLIQRIEKRLEATADWTADISGKPLFLLVHFIWWGCWIGFKVEKFPYGLLTMILSLEAIVLSALILSAGNRAGFEDRRISRKDLNVGLETKDLVEDAIELIQDALEDIQDVKVDLYRHIENSETEK